MALMAQALSVAFLIEAAFRQRHDVVTLRGQPYAAMALALCTQGVFSKEGLAHLLQLAPGDALGCLA